MYDFIFSFCHRPNLFLEVNRKSIVQHDLKDLLIQKSKYELFLYQICILYYVRSTLLITTACCIFRDNLNKSFEGSTIIYCPTKKETENVASALKGKTNLASIQKNNFQCISG